MKNKEKPKPKPKEFAASPFRALKGAALELQGTVAERCPAMREVDSQPPAHDHPRFRRVLAQRSSHSRQQYLAVGALDNVVGRAVLDADDLVGRRVASTGQDDDRECNSIGPKTKRVEDFGSFHVRHLVVQQHQIRRAQPNPLQRFSAAVGYVDCVTGAPQQLRRQLRGAWLVVNDK